ncbi:hypothetical protein O6H91_10G071800 [Diphasiastrum complanatum]|uniref:Uncharacterized protein n=1 Tax=Diphasiastrum complanatum TaxID=34168 RepID=A0ACC2CIF5_DIPCM|nr:hypothetical protein O6H91_10G071800 [Diphasiastrum complanatum]
MTCVRMTCVDRYSALHVDNASTSRDLPLDRTDMPTISRRKRKQAVPKKARSQRLAASLPPRHIPAKRPRVFLSSESDVGEFDSDRESSPLPPPVNHPAP